MRVQRVLMPNADLESWAVLGDDGPIEPVDRYLAYLTAIERSPNTIKGYAHDLKDWFTYLAGAGWIGRRPRWRTSPGRGLASPAACGSRWQGGGAALGRPPLHRAQREPQALGAGPVCEFHARHGVDLGELLITMRPAGGVVARRGNRFCTTSPSTSPSGAARSNSPSPRRSPRSSPPARCRRSWTPASTCGTGCCSRSCWTPACGSGRRWGCGTRTWRSPSAS
jgi:hypothetical protein